MYIKWRGKYPVPWNAEDISTIYTDKKINHFTVKNDLGPVKLENDVEKKLFECIFNKLYEKYVNAKLGSAQTKMQVVREIHLKNW
jgi:hypothetical protein